jgi:hypothetical protein
MAIQDLERIQERQRGNRSRPPRLLLLLLPASHQQQSVVLRSS